jgi:hypothetical protein
VTNKQRTSLEKRECDANVKTSLSARRKTSAPGIPST